ncbi:hypothetical protein MCM1_0432 [Methanosarcina barkeri CM1]|uniref:Transposase n=1 Tax=Methanosarcina barkeri CM1 TaxID=796385 RepID=A0A0G3CC59_METBA|nr:hypothetical protein MCM1_0432 [Methanosarcina barkeri CM1]
MKFKSYTGNYFFKIIYELIPKLKLLFWISYFEYSNEFLVIRTILKCYGFKN